jgi:hypothetical protein
MKRRQFIAASSVAGLALGGSAATTLAGEGPGKQLIELQLYQMASLDKQKAFDEFLAKAAVPALNRVGVSPVGVFRILKDDNAALKMEADSPNLYVLLPHKSAESVVTMLARLADEGGFPESARSVLEAPKADPAFVRYDSSLLLGFDQFPKVEVPAKGDSRLFQLRIYESHNWERALAKIAMFNEGGEIETFKRCGMTPVFFGQSLVGSKLPNLTYMLGFDSKEAMDKAWGAFRQDPAWKKLSADPTYKDTVSTITNIILRPAASSQI